MKDDSYRGPLFTANELYELYRLTAEALTSTVMGDGWPGSDLRAVEQRLHKLRRSAASADSVALYESLIETTSTLTSLLKGTNSGVQGEVRLATTLRLLATESICMGPMEFSAGPYHEEFDLVVVSNACIHILEAKNAKNQYDIDVHGMLYNRYKYQSSYPIPMKFRYKRAAIHHLLSDALGSAGEGIYIDTCLVLMNEKAKVECRCPSIDWYYTGELLAHIEAMSKSAGDADGLDIDAVADVIASHSRVARFPPALDPAAAYRVVCDLFDEVPHKVWCEALCFMLSSPSIPMFRTKNGDPKQLPAA